MGARQLKQARYADKISTISPQEREQIQSILNYSVVEFGSYNNRSIENVVAIRQPTHYDADRLRVVRKYAPNIKSFTDTHSLYQEKDLIEISKMSSLEELRIKVHYAVSIDKAISKIFRLKNLKSFYYDDFKLTYEDLAYIVRIFCHLESLSFNISSIEFPKDVLEILSVMKNLRELTIDHSKHVKQWLLISIVKSAPHLTKLTFGHCYFEDKEMWRVLENLTHLKHLNLNVHTYTDRHLFFQNLPSLPKLESFDSSQIWDFLGTQSLSLLAKKYPKLKEAHFRMIRKIDDEFVIKMTELWKDLRVVDLSSEKLDRSISIVGIEALVKNHPNIHTLDLRKCFEISDKSLIVISTLRELKNLRLDNCELSTRGIVYLGKLKKLQHLDLTSNSLTTSISLKLLKTLKLFTLNIWQQEQQQHIFPRKNKKKKESIHEISHVLYPW